MRVHIINQTVKESHLASVELFLLVLLIVFAQVQVSPLVEIITQQLFESLTPAFLQIIHTLTAVTVRNAAHKQHTLRQYRWCDFLVKDHQWLEELNHECVGLTCGRLWSRFWADTAVSSPVPSLCRAETHKPRPAHLPSGHRRSGNRRTALRTPHGHRSVLCLHMYLTRWRDRI